MFLLFEVFLHYYHWTYLQSKRDECRILIFGQVSGKFFYMKNPKCLIAKSDIMKLNNGICEGGILNTWFCGFDDGDCITFNLGYTLSVSTICLNIQ